MVSDSCEKIQLYQPKIQKNILVVTASRADYGIYLPVLKAIREYSGLKLRLEPFCPPETWASYIETPLDCDFPKGRENCVVVLGDTMPMLRAAIYAAEQNIPVAHIHGGDKTGSIDDKIRPAISCFADYHFPSLPAHADRLWQMGIPGNRIKVVGPLGVYAMKDTSFLSDSELRTHLNLSTKPIILVIQHPVTGEANEENIRITLDAVSRFHGYEVVVIYPNSEVTSRDMIKAIREYPFKSFVNLPYLTFLSLLRYSAVIVGNSSCALVEAPLFGVPAVNIGTRQGQRERGVSFTAYYDFDQIYDVLTMLLDGKGKMFGQNPYDTQIDGASIIANTLAEGI